MKKMKDSSLMLAAMVLLSVLVLPGANAVDQALDPNWGLKAGTATFEELEATSQIFNGRMWKGTQFNVIDGTLWVSGENRNGQMGLPELATGDMISTPRYVPAFYNPDNKSLPKAVQVQGGFGMVLADDGKIYMVQKCTDGNVGYEYKPAPFYAKNANPFDGNKVIKLGKGPWAQVQNPQTGKKSWYFWGVDYGQCSETLDSMTASRGLNNIPTPLSAAFQSAIGEKEIIDIDRGGHYKIAGSDGIVILTNDGELYSLGSWTVNGKGSKSENVYGIPYHLTGNGILSGKKILQIFGSWGNFGVLDSEGNVWGWGMNRYGVIPGIPFSNKYADTENAVVEPTSMYSSGDAHYILTTANRALILTKDNRIMMSTAGRKMEEAFGMITQKETVLALADSEYHGNILLTKSGNKYTNSNTSGWAGTGAIGGSYLDKPIPEIAIPITKPLSKNQISMEVVTTDTKGDIHKYSSWSGADLTNITVRAGQRLRVDIYMEDFAKLNLFQIPLSFDPTYLKVVDNSGKKYTDELEIHPGYNGESGLKTKIPSKTYNPEASSTIWEGGTMVENASMPVVNNADGYVTVVGDATATDKQLHAKINGKQLMYSVEFVSVAETPTGETTGFSISEPKDPAWPKEAQWFALREGQSVKESGFAFENPDFVSFKLQEVKLEDLDLNLLRDETYTVTDKSKETGEEAYYVLDKRNTDATYKIATIATPPTASFPDVESWTVTAAKDLNTGADISDYITVLSQLDDPGSIQFRIDSSIGTNANVTNAEGAFVPAYIKVTANSVRIPNKDGKPAKMREMYIKIVDNVPAPETLSIANKGSGEGEFNDPQGIAGVFKANATSSSEFSSRHSLVVDYQFTFEAAFTGSGEGYSKDVSWQLLQVTKRGDDGSVEETTPLGTDASAPVVISATGTKKEDKTPTCTVQAQQSTETDDDIVLKLSSSVDPAICDYVEIGVQLAPYEIKYPVETTTLVYGSGLKQQYDLTANLQVSPVDATGYTVEYDTNVKANGRDNANVQIVTSTKEGQTTALVDPIRSDAEFNSQWYDEVTVRAKATVNGQPLTLERKLKIYTIDAVPPANMYVQGINAAGDERDYIKFAIDKKKSQLEPGDKITIYPDFTTDTILEGYNNRVLTQADIDQMWSTGLKVPEGLNDAGGSFGYVLERKSQTPSAKTPVLYDPAAIKISGFVRLDGKLANSSANNGVTVTLEGVKGADGKSLSTLTKSDGSRYGFFEFDQYVPATTHKLVISKTNYLTRNVTFTMKKSDNFEVSTYEKPILLYPGDMDGKRGIQYDDVNEYRLNYVGRYLSKGEVGASVFDAFNFVDEDAGDTPAINVWDLGIIQLRITYQTSDYPGWSME